MKNMSIGNLSKMTGVKIPTIRYYEGIGLLKAAERTDSNRRTYDTKDIERLTFIRHSRDLGFSIEDISALLAMTEQPQTSCDRADSIARHHLEDIERRIARLEKLKGELQRMVEACGQGKICDCRVIEVLSDHHECGSDHGRIAM